MRVTILGAGAWGTALAILWCQTGHEVRLAARTEEKARALNTDRENKNRLPGVSFPEQLQITTLLDDHSSSDVIVLALPAQITQKTLAERVGALPQNAPVISTAKGIDAETGERLSSGAGKVLVGRPMIVLSGPSFAADLAAGAPIAVTLASDRLALAQQMANSLSARQLRLYPSDDVPGVELAGAIKNVYAIAAGISEGLGLGASAKAGLIARAHAELVRFVTAFGGRPETVSGLAGLGDLILTCSSTQSRNMAFGLKIGGGVSSESALQSSNGVVEGMATTSVVTKMAQSHGVDMPIAQTVKAVLYEDLPPETALTSLLERPIPKRENEP